MTAPKPTDAAMDAAEHLYIGGRISLPEKVPVARALDAFAAEAVAAKQKELTDLAWMFWAQKLDAAVAAEREACAKICDRIANGVTPSTAMYCARDIRARGAKNV